MNHRTSTRRNLGTLFALVILMLAGALIWSSLDSVVGADSAGQTANAAAGNVAAGSATIVEARNASAKGKWTEVRNSLANCGAYMSAGPEGVGTCLEFPIEVAAATEIAVSPIWFANGDQRNAKRFPETADAFNVQQFWPIQPEAWEYPRTSVFATPVVSKPGPDAIDVFKDKAFFSAPVGGKVGILDIKAEKVSGVIDVGGYVSDLVVDQGRAELLVADASGNRVVVFGAKDGKQLAEIPVPALPWSLALHKDKLYVASMAAKKITVIDVAARKITGDIDLPVGPQNVAIVGGERPQLIVRMLPYVLDMKTLKEVPADRLTYWPSGNWDQLEKPVTDLLAKAAAAYPKAKAKAYFSSNRGIGAAILDAGPMHGRTRSGFANKPFITKVFVADPSFKGLISMDADTGKSTRIELEESPAALEVCDLKLYGVLRESKKVVELDAMTEKVLRTAPLPYLAQEFYAGYFVGKQTTVEQFDCGEVIDGYLPGRIAVGLAPLAFDPGTLAPGGESSLPFFPYDRRSIVLTSDPKPRQLFVDNVHTIRVDDKPTTRPSGSDSIHWIDTSAVTDYHLANNPARLRTGDAPGAVTFRVDDGPECDWENGVWFTPRQRSLLVRGTDEFDLHNGVRFTLKPGKHVLKVKAFSPQANLEGIRIRRTLAGAIDVQLKPLPADQHDKVPLPGYGGVFTAGEEVSFDLNVANKSDRLLYLACNWTVQNYEGKTVLSGKDSFVVKAAASSAHPLKLDLKESGRFTIRLKFSSDGSEHEVFNRFVRLPKLEHPTLLYRAEETGQIKARVAQYPLLYQRYRDWLRRQGDTPGFLPKTMRGGTGEGMPVENKKWRAIAMQFSDMFLEPAGAKKYESKLLPFLSWAGGTDAWQGDYEFGGAHTILNDLMISTCAAGEQNIDKFYRAGSGYIGDNFVAGSVFVDYLAIVKEPLTPRDRAVLFRVAMELNNYDAYFGAHAGQRGGNWWHGTNTWCHCAITSVVRSFLWCRNFFGEKNFFERNNISGLLTMQNYVDPRYDNQNYTLHGSVRESTDVVNNGTAMRWALSGLSRKPLEATYYKEIFDCIKTLGAPMADEAKQVDEIFAKGANVVVPLYLAIGWIDPSLKAADWEEMPPSMLFEAEGVAGMKSGWDKNMTDIYFTCGVKDTSYRVLPNHFTIFKAGQMVVGAQQMGDHGEPVPFYGNSVRVGEEEGCRDYTRRAGAYNRMQERLVANVYEPLACTYMFRDWRLSTYRQEGAYWCGGGHEHTFPREVTLHSHSSHPFIADGRIVAYETSPAFDYVVGNATNTWPVDDVKEAYRQIVFVRPDVIVMYDRVLLGDAPKTVKWPLLIMENKANPGAGGLGAKLKDDVFSCTDNVASVWGRALLPKGGKIGVQRGYIEIKPPDKQKAVEFLVVFRLGLAEPAALECSLQETKERVGVKFAYENSDYVVLFDREAGAGGHIKIGQGAKQIVDRDLSRGIKDTYENWKGTAQFEKWMSDDRFKSYVTESDRKRFGAVKP